MEIERLGADALRASLKTGCDYLELNREILDNLNVYPVPDGDTGVNMLSTLKPAVEELERARCASLTEIAGIMNTVLARNSRGNSGFILAQFFRGFWEAVGTPGSDQLDRTALVRGFEKGSFLAVSSLLSPVEGTMITIIGSMLEAMRPLENNNIVLCLRKALEAGIQSLFHTPEQLPLLAEAGVVDAGALGFIFIIKGMLCGILQDTIQAEVESDYRLTPRTAATSPAGRSGRTRHTEFRYCVELDIETTPTAAAPVSLFVDYLRHNGGSVALIADTNRLRIHVHTNAPETIIKASEPYGTLSHSKIEDMEEQIESARQTETAGGSNPAGQIASGNHPGAQGQGAQGHASAAVLSIIPGAGFRKLFLELGAAECHAYSHKLPSVDDLLKSVERMDGDEVIILPNNPNIIPTVRLLNEQTQRRVYALGTRNVVDGITAMYGYVDVSPANENIRNMKDCIGLAETLNVFMSSRDARFGEYRISSGDYFVVKDGQLLSTSASMEESVAAVMKKINTTGRSNMAFYYGDDFNIGDLENLKEEISSTNSAIQFEQHYGGQAQCVLIIAVE